MITIKPRLEGFQPGLGKQTCLTMISGTISYTIPPLASAAPRPSWSGPWSALKPGSFQLHITNGSGDAASFVRETCQAQAGSLRFYACGGDGTLGEVATGAHGFPQAEIGVWPCGSGNDYVKYYGGVERFLDLNAQMKAGSVPVDLMQVGERCAINAINVGLEARRRKPC